VKGGAPERQLTGVNEDLEVRHTLDAIYHAYAPRVAGWAARLAGPSLDAEDIVHEVFLTVHKELPRFRGDSKLTTWLYGITANIVRDRRRKEQRRWLRHLLSYREQSTLHPGVQTPAEAAERQQATTVVYKALDGLRDNYRTVLILFELEGLSGEQIAELTHVNVNTVWVWLHRARAQFRAQLRKQHPAEFQASRRAEGRT